MRMNMWTRHDATDVSPCIDRNEKTVKLESYTSVALPRGRLTATSCHMTVPVTYIYEAPAQSMIDAAISYAPVKSTGFVLRATTRFTTRRPIDSAVNRRAIKANAWHMKKYLSLLRGSRLPNSCLLELQ